MSVTSIAPWFGSNRMLAEHVGRELRSCSWVGVVFAGGMSELAHISARTMLVNDLHRHVINLAWVMGDRTLGPQLYRRLRRKVFHPAELAWAQKICKAQDSRVVGSGLFDSTPSPTELLTWAEAYFVSAWMPRHGSSGTKGEFDAGLSFRWTASGGDSAKHYWSAVESMNAWRSVLRRANFVSMDFAEFLGKCKREPGVGIYCDPPFPGPGDAYAHTFGEARHRELSRILHTYRNARVVCRYYDHPLIRELYADWRWVRLEGRKQTNEAGPEVLIVNDAEIP